MSARGILPTYQRFVNGMPVPFSRRSFRPREKYVIFLVFVTFGLVCFGTFFFLPEFRTGGTAESVYKVYDQIKRAAPELLIPPPPHLEDSRESPKLIRHEEDFRVDPHVIGDREKLKAKIDQDGELKVLERPDMGFQRTSSTARQPIVANQVDENVGAEDLGGPEIVTVPPAPSDHFPLTIGGEDKDSTARERRDKVKEVSVNHWPYNSINSTLLGMTLTKPNFDRNNKRRSVDASVTSAPVTIGRGGLNAATSPLTG
ncbi:mannosyl-oligosaccharide alpha-1,2-mannosidase IA-like [Anoplophora glabripennis]|uniref:mannosyl-oligosaccharide alpha-1,2-mannosidase IA-like n=1 Tax=Anoplophora glabripennis TaxID=217634 RepID=UPI000873BA50|nr:mannosyl-oligosaccharide alpha-1,2-mannosidase IA-like [Anoplophora glabripennis]